MTRRFGRHLWELLLASAAMWLAVSPLVMARFHLLTPAAVLLNVLLLPFVTMAMFSGLGILVFGWWLPPLARLFGWFCDWNLSVLSWAVKGTDRLPVSHAWVAGPSEWWLAVFYLALAAMIFAPRWRPPLRWSLALFGAWCGVGLLAALPTHSSGDTLWGRPTDQHQRQHEKVC